ncbi:MAG: IclR family transcriptional regulator, partial [Arthrobacter sp.]|nr:IclR family transcriptional regulator [Arthrobacter sp.]
MATEAGAGASPLLVLHKVAEILDCFSVDEPEPTLQQIIRK